MDNMVSCEKHYGCNYTNGVKEFRAAVCSQCWDSATRLQYLHIERHKGHKTVVLNDFGQLCIQKVKFLEEGVGSQVIQQVGEVHDFCVEVQVEGCTIQGIKKQSSWCDG